MLSFNHTPLTGGADRLLFLNQSSYILKCSVLFNASNYIFIKYRPINKSMFSYFSYC